MPFQISNEQLQKLKQFELMLAQIMYDVDEVNRKLKCLLASIVVTPDKDKEEEQLTPFTPSW